MGHPDPGRWTEITVRLDAGSSDLCAAVLFALGAQGVRERYPELEVGSEGPALSGDPGEWAPPPPSPEGPVWVSGYFPPTPEWDPAQVAPVLQATLAEHGTQVEEIRWDEVPDEDWHAKWREGFQAFALTESIWVTPSWLEERIPDGSAGLRMDPGMAFGTGTHATTRACAVLLGDVLADNEGATVLDVGTGTGILAMAAVRCGAGRVVAVDTDPLAVEVAAENLQANGLTARIELRLGSANTVEGAFTVVLANLLAPVLDLLAEDLVARLGPGSAIIWSGVLVGQRDAVVARFERLGLRLEAEIEDEAWVGVRMRR